MRSSLLALFVATGLHAQMPYGYEWMNAAPSPQIVARGVTSQGGSSSGHGQPNWRWSVGYAVRNFEADFKTPAPGLGPIAPYLGGIGDVGFYRGGSGVLSYEDGFVGPGYGDGTAFGSVTSDWATPGNPADPNFDRFGPIFAIGPGLDRRDTKTFHAKMFQGPDDEAKASGEGSGFGPYVRMSLTLAESESGSLGLSVTWTGLHGQMDASSFLGHPRRTDFIYTYDDIYFVEPNGPVPNSFISANGLVIDADAVNALYEQAFGTHGTFRNPRKSTQSYTITDWTAAGYSSLDVRLNEIFLSADAVWKPRRGWELGLSAGPTLNVVGTTLNSRTAWVRNDGLAVPGATTRQNDTHVAVGAGVQGVARYDLTRDGRAFIEARAGYKWLNDIAIKGPAASADLDLSDWEVGLGVGIRLNDWPAGSPWSVRGGVDTRTLSFKTGVADKAAMKSLFNRSSGRGDVGFFNGRDTIQYDDGYIEGTEPGPLPVVVVFGGYNTFSIDHASQADLEYNDGLFPLFGTTDGYIHFHSTNMQSDLRDVSSSGRRDEETALSPYVELHRDIGAWGPVSAGLTWGWSGWNDHYSQERALSATATALQTVSTYQYSYPYSRFGKSSLLSGTSFPFGEDSLIADPRFFDFGRPDTRSKRGTTRTSLVRYYAFTSASVDVSMQTLSFAGDLAWKPLKHLELAFSAGPTVNVVSTSTDLSTDWVREDGLLFARLQDHEEKTQLCLGFRLMASARYDLTRDGRWYAEARGGYEWMQDIDVGIGLQAASIEATSWQVGGGIGCRLGVRPRLEAIRHLKPDKPKAVLPTTAAPPRGPLTARKAQ